MADALTSTGDVTMVSPTSFLLLRFLGKPEATARPQIEKGEILDSSWGSLQGTGTLRDYLGEKRMGQKFHGALRWAEGRPYLASFPASTGQSSLPSGRIQGAEESLVRIRGLA